MDFCRAKPRPASATTAKNELFALFEMCIIRLSRLQGVAGGVDVLRKNDTADRGGVYMKDLRSALDESEVRICPLVRATLASI
jgi:hypothetical protein